MKIKAFRCKASELKPGDLFSVAGEEYWSNNTDWNQWGALGEKVYIRTTVPCPADEVDNEIYKIKIIKDKK